MANDRPSINDSLKSLLSEVNEPEPYRLSLNNSKVITFPDVFNMEAEEGEKFMEEMERLSDTRILKKWLSEKDFEALRDEKLTLRQRKVVMERVQAYYEGTFGKPGEDDASKS